MDLTARLVHWRCNSVDLNLLLCFHSHRHTHGCKHTQWHACSRIYTCAHTQLHKRTHIHADTHAPANVVHWAFWKQARQARCVIQMLVGSAAMKRRRKSKTEQESWTRCSSATTHPANPTGSTVRRGSPRAVLHQAWHPHAASGTKLRRGSAHEDSSRPDASTPGHQLLPWGGTWWDILAS